MFAQVDRHSEVSVGTQLATQLHSAMADGGLSAGDRLPSIRELADATGVSVNTVRAVYARLEDEGLARSEHGRGTFVADERGTRRELRRQIERLEAAVARGPQRGTASSGAPAGRLLTTEELRGVRDALRAEVERLDVERAELMQRLSEIERLEVSEQYDERAREAAQDRRSSTSLANVRLRWVGG